jgi:hypothetical protein
MNHLKIVLPLLFPIWAKISNTDLHIGLLSVEEFLENYTVNKVLFFRE